MADELDTVVDCPAVITTLPPVPLAVVVELIC